MPEVLSLTQVPSFFWPVPFSVAGHRDRVSLSVPRWTVNSACSLLCSKRTRLDAPDTGWPSTARMASPFLRPAAEAGDRSPASVCTVVSPTTWTPLVYRTMPTARPPSRTIGKADTSPTVLRGTRPKSA